MTTKGIDIAQGSINLPLMQAAAPGAINDPTVFNGITIHDGAPTPDNHLYGFKVAHYLHSSVDGGRYAIEGMLEVLADPGAEPGKVQGMYSGIAGVAKSSRTVSKGTHSLYGGNFYAYLGGQCSGWTNVTGAEINTDLHSQVSIKTGAQIVDFSSAAGRGSAVDAAIAISAGTAESGYKYGVLFSSQYGGGTHLRTGGTLIHADHCPNTFEFGIHIANLKYTVAAIHTPGFIVWPQGNFSMMTETKTAPAGGGGGLAFGIGSFSNPTAPFGVYFGSGAPSIAAGKGSIYLRTDGNTNTERMYINVDGWQRWTPVVTAF